MRQAFCYISAGYREGNLNASLASNLELSTSGQLRLLSFPQIHGPLRDEGLGSEFLSMPTRSSIDKVGELVPDLP